MIAFWLEIKSLSLDVLSHFLGAPARAPKMLVGPGMKIKGEEETCAVPLSLIEKVSGRNMQAEENLPLEYS